MRQHASKRNRRPNQCIKFLIPSNGKLQVTWRDTFDLQILCRVTGQLQNFCGQVFEDGGEVDGGLGTDARLLSRYRAEVTLYAAAGKLRESLCQCKGRVSSTRGVRDGGLWG